MVEPLAQLALLGAWVFDDAKGLAGEIGRKHRARLFLAASGDGHDQLATPAPKILFAGGPTFPIIPGAAEPLDQVGRSFPTLLLIGLMVMENVRLEALGLLA